MSTEFSNFFPLASDRVFFLFLYRNDVKLSIPVWFTYYKETNGTWIHFGPGYPTLKYEISGNSAEEFYNSSASVNWNSCFSYTVALEGNTITFTMRGIDYSEEATLAADGKSFALLQMNNDKTFVKQ